MRWPDRGLTAAINADAACQYLVVFIPPDCDYLAIEPVTHMTDAFNRAAAGQSDTGTRLLAPGATVVHVTSHWAHLYGSVPQLPDYEPVARSKHAGEEALRARIRVRGRVRGLHDRGFLSPRAHERPSARASVRGRAGVERAGLGVMVRTKRS